MNLLNIYKKTIATIFSEPAIAMFFMLYIISSSFLGGAALSTKTSFNALVMVFCFFVFALCFVSGWLEIIKESAKTPQFREDKSHWGVFLEGIGKNIVSLGIGFFIYLALFIFAITLSAKISQYFVGNVDFISKEVISNIQSNQALMEYFNSLPDNQKYILSVWQLVYIFSTLTFAFLMLFYYPAIVFDEKTNIFIRPIVALKNAFCFLFKNFFGALMIHVSVFVVYFLLNYISMKFGANVIVSALLIFCHIYFISAAIMLIFNYYEQRNNCANGCNCIGENQDIDKSSQEN